MPNRAKTTLGFIHVTATPPGWDKGVAGLRAIHKAMGWSDVGYNSIINPNGSWAVARGHDAIGSHVAGFNSISYGLSMVGGVNAKGQPDFNTVKHLLPALENAMRQITVMYPAIKWLGHRDASPDKNGNGIIEPHEWIKACPTFDVIPWAASLGLPVADINGKWSPVVLEAGAAPVFKGPDTRIAYMQRLLDRAGFKFGPVDGIMGDKTRKAIMAFQKAVGIAVTGEFDTLTSTRLRARFEAKAAA